MNMTISGVRYLGLFGSVGSGGEIRDLGLEHATVTGAPGWVEGAPNVRHFTGSIWVAGLVGCNDGTITRCYCSGAVNGDARVAGLVGTNSGSIFGSYTVGTVIADGGEVGGLVALNSGHIADSYSACMVDGNSSVSGLAALNGGSISGSHSTGTVSGDEIVGGLVASNDGRISTSYSTGVMSGSKTVGGLVASNDGRISTSYSTGVVSGSKTVGGLVASNDGWITASYSTGLVTGDENVGGLVGDGNGYVLHSIWDTEGSGLLASHFGVGLTTAEMMDPHTLGLNGFSTDPNWILDPDRDYPRLAWESTAGQKIPAPSINWLEGEGTPQNAYRINAGGQLALLAEVSFLWDKCFVLSSDIDLDPNLPEGQVFGHAVIPEFYGVFDGNNLTISHLTIVGQSDRGLGLFGRLYSEGEVRNLHIADVNIIGSGSSIGGLTGINQGLIASCYSMGTVAGDNTVGGLVGINRGDIDASQSSGGVNAQETAGILVGENDYSGRITNCSSSGTIYAAGWAGGLVGYNRGSITDSSNNSTVRGDWATGGLVGCSDWFGFITTSQSTGAVSGGRSTGGLAGYNGGTISQCGSSAPATGSEDAVGGLVGNNSGSIAMSYSTGAVSGNSMVGGLVGNHSSGPDMGYGPGNFITACYSTGAVSGNENVGGLVGGGTISFPDLIAPGRFVVPMSYWDIDTSGQSSGFTSPFIAPSGIDEVTGLTTAEMQTASTFLEAGWDFVGETENGPNDVWKIVEGQTYPLLSWQKYGGGTGEPNDPYLIYTTEHLNALGAEPNDYDKHFKLMADIDLSGCVYDRAVIAPDVNDNDGDFQGAVFTGCFDGNVHTISNLRIVGDSYLGLFGEVAGSDTEIRNVILVDANIIAEGNYAGILVGQNGVFWRPRENWGGRIVNCSVSGVVDGRKDVGGLSGYNYAGRIERCCAEVTISGFENVGGLIGLHGRGRAGGRAGLITDSYAKGTVFGEHNVGGLAGESGGAADDGPDQIVRSYSVVQVSGSSNLGAFVGSFGAQGSFSDSFYNHEVANMDACGVRSCSGITGLTTAEMQTATTFLDAGWDFVDETENGTDDIWWILEGQDYPRLWWELEN